MVVLFKNVKMESCCSWRCGEVGDVGSGSLGPKESRAILIHDYDVE